MARSKKLKHTFEIVKPDVKQSAYLLLWYRELDIRRNEAGSLSVDLEDIEKSSGASAWTTLSAAKRSAAATVGRSRLTWTEKEEDGTKVWSSSYDEKVSE